jgi:hypothetical protein
MNNRSHRRRMLYLIVGIVLILGTSTVGRRSAAAPLAPPPVDFAPPVNYPTSSAARMNAVGDFNHDGSIDLAVVHWGGARVTVHLNTGTGAFVGPVDYLVSSGMWGLATGDLNNDGHLDLVTANRQSSSVSVLRGVGDGTFIFVGSTAVGAGPTAVRLGDFNKDGNLDAVLTHFDSNTISVLFGTGTGTFGTPQFYTIGVGPIFALVQDFNNDTNLDLGILTVNPSTNVSSLVIRIGNSAGVFSPGSSYATGPGGGAGATGDLNGDGFSDIVVSNAFGNTVSIFLGTGTGTFTLLGTPAIPSPSSVLITDINADTKIDILISNSPNTTTPGTVSVLLGNGDATFEPRTAWATGINPNSIAVGDFNNDSLMDISTANYHGDNMSILLARAPVVPTVTPTATATPGGTPKLDVFLPLLVDTRPRLLVAINPGVIPLRPISTVGEIYYTTTFTLNTPLPAGGRFYLSASATSVTAVTVDDELAILMDGQEVYARLLTTPQMVELPRSLLESWGSQPVTVIFRDVYGDVVGSQPVWLIWQP